MNKLRLLAVIAIVSLFLVGCSEGSAPEGGAKAGGSGAYPYMGVKELDSFIADHPGKPTMVFFWATWCPSCKQQMPDLEALYKSHGEKLNILAVSLDDKVEALEQYFADKKIDLPVYFGDSAMAERFNVSAIPTMVIFNKQGKQTFGQPGVFPQSMLKAMAEKLISE